MRISELAETVGIPTSTVRYYERIGLLAGPGRTTSGYRNYDDDAASRLLFVTRARRMGLSCEQVASLVGIWDGTHCQAASRRVAELIEEKKREVRDQIQELRRFGAQLGAVQRELEASPAPATCRTDLSCCVPASRGPVDVDVVSRRPSQGAQ